MKLLLRRDQKSSLLGKVVFTLVVRAEITKEEADCIKKYKLGETMIYERAKIEGGTGLLGVASRFALRMINLSISVNELEKGKQIDCKDILEMLAVEDQVKEAAQNFHAILTAASTFGGEEVIQY